MGGELLRFLVERVAPLWHKPAIGIGFAVAVALMVLYSSAETGVAGLTGFGYAAGAVTFIGITAFWLYMHHVPRTQKGKVGIVLAITSDDEAEARQVKFDFLDNLRQLLQRDPDGANFHVLVLPAFATQRVTEFSEAERFLTKARGHLMLFGRARRRQIESKDVHLLNLEGIVRHAPIPIEVSQRLAQDFGEAIPRRVKVPVDNDALSFETTSIWADLSARYVIGIAAFLSGSVGYAERLFIGVETQLRTAEQLPAFLSPIVESLPGRIIQVYLDWMTAAADAYFLTRERVYVEKQDELASKLLERDSEDPRGLVAKAMGDFVLRRDVAAARGRLERCRKVRDVAWRYSLAFLCAYEGDLEAAHDEYRRAFRSTAEVGNIPIQSEEFIQIVLEEEPEKEQLHFCLGLINYNAKKDFVSAGRDFDRFLSSASADRSRTAKRLAEDLRERSARQARGSDGD